MSNITCPPQHTEDKMDTENTVLNEKNIDMAYIINKIDDILNDTKYLYDAIEAIKVMEPTRDGSGQSKGNALGQIVKCREETNRKVIDFLNKIYDDIKPPRVQEAYQNEDILKLQALQKILSDPSINSMNMEAMEILRDSIDDMCKFK